MGWNHRDCRWDRNCLSDRNMMDCLHFLFIPSARCAWFLPKLNLMRPVTLVHRLNSFRWKFSLAQDLIRLDLRHLLQQKQWARTREAKDCKKDPIALCLLGFQIEACHCALVPFVCLFTTHKDRGRDIEGFRVLENEKQFGFILLPFSLKIPQCAFQQSFVMWNSGSLSLSYLSSNK